MTRRRHGTSVGQLRERVQIEQDVEADDGQLVGAGMASVRTGVGSATAARRFWSACCPPIRGGRSDGEEAYVTLTAGPYQALPPMPPEQFAALKADIAERGVLTPIDVDEHGTILDGHHRHRACSELGVTDVPTVVRLGLDEEHKRAFARKSNALRRHLTRQQVRQLIADQLRDTPQWANNRIGRELGVDSKTVATARKRLEATSEIPKFDRLIGADGKERPTAASRPPSIMAATRAELERVLARAAEVAPDQVQGFFSEQSFAVISTPHYDPFAGRTEAECRAWHLFRLFLVQTCGCDVDGAWNHVEWLLQRPFQTVDEWLGEPGAETRSCWGDAGDPREDSQSVEAVRHRAR